MRECIECREEENLVKIVAKDTGTIIYACQDCINNGEIENICDLCTCYFEEGLYDEDKQLCRECYEVSRNSGGAEAATEIGIEKILDEQEYTEMECDEIWKIYGKIPAVKFFDHDDIFLKFRDVLENEDMGFKNKIKELKKTAIRYCR